MDFDEFLKKGLVRKSPPDFMLARSLFSTAKKDLQFLRSLEINENSSRKIMANYYEVLRSILEAISSIDGFKIYSHEAFTYFLKEKNEELLSIQFDRFRKIRNSINYYGKDISIEETKENIREIEEIIKSLSDKYLRGLK